MRYEMTCTGAAGEWWNAGDDDDLFESLEEVLDEFAREDLGYFGYGDPEPKFACNQHEGEFDLDCTDCHREMNYKVSLRVERWALLTTEEYIEELRETKTIVVRLGDNKIVVHIQEVE